MKKVKIYKSNSKVKYNGHTYKIKQVKGGSCQTCDLLEPCNIKPTQEFEKLVQAKKLACLSGKLPNSFIYKKL